MALSNSQFDAIMRVYNQRQFLNKRRQDERIREVYERIPQVEALTDEIAAAMQKVCENPDFQAEMAGLLYSAVTAEEADLEASRQFISDKRDIGQEIIDVAPGLDELT